MNSVTAAAIAAALCSASCLVGRETLPADAETTPLIPPSVIEGATRPLPGQMIFIDGDDPRALSQTFVVKIARSTVIDADHALIARAFTDRQRVMGCGADCTEAGQIVNCTADSDAGQVRTCTFSRSFSADGNCHYVDFYVSSHFRDDFTTEPSREGDIAHVRWFVAVKHMGNLPPIETCFEHAP